MKNPTTCLARICALLTLFALGPTAPGYGGINSSPNCNPNVDDLCASNSAKRGRLTRTFSPQHATKHSTDAGFELTYSDFLALFPIGREVEVFLSPPGDIYQMDVGFWDLDNAQSWTAPSIPFGAPSNWTIIDPAGSGYGHLFPGATHVLVSTNDQIREGTIYLFYSFAEAGVQIEGEVAVLPGEGGEELYEYGVPLTLFPMNASMGFYLEEEVLWNGEPAVFSQDVAMHGFGTFTFPGGGAAAKGATALPVGVFFDDIVVRDPNAPEPLPGEPEEILTFDTYYSIFSEDGSWYSFYIADPPDGSPTPIDGEVFVEAVSYWRPVEMQAVAVEPATELAEAYTLSPAYPNPFNPTTQFTLAVAQEQAVTATVYDAMGRQVGTLFDGRLPAQETRTLTFAADALPSGPYFLRVAGERFAATEQVMLVK